MLDEKLIIAYQTNTDYPTESISILNSGKQFSVSEPGPFYTDPDPTKLKYGSYLPLGQKTDLDLTWIRRDLDPDLKHWLAFMLNSFLYLGL